MCGALPPFPCQKRHFSASLDALLLAIVRGNKKKRIASCWKAKERKSSSAVIKIALLRVQEEKNRIFRDGEIKDGYFKPKG